MARNFLKPQNKSFIFVKYIPRNKLRAKYKNKCKWIKFRAIIIYYTYLYIKKLQLE